MKISEDYHVFDNYDCRLVYVMINFKIQLTNSFIVKKLIILKMIKFLSRISKYLLDVDIYYF